MHNSLAHFYLDAYHFANDSIHLNNAHIYHMSNMHQNYCFISVAVHLFLLSSPFLKVSSSKCAWLFSLSNKPLRLASVSEQFLPHTVNARGVTCDLAWKHDAVSMHHHPLSQISHDLEKHATK